MNKKTQTKENAFDMGIAGTTGAMDYSAGFGTPASPDIRQNPDEFVKSKTLGNNSNTAASAPAQPTDINQSINQIYNKPITPTPDEVKSGLDYELKNMVKKDKGRAKELVITNLKKDPHYYGKLKMLNIDDGDDTIPSDNVSISEQHRNEREHVLNKMQEEKNKKFVSSSCLRDALNETRNRKNQRYQSS